VALGLPRQRADVCLFLTLCLVLIPGRLQMRSGWALQRLRSGDLTGLIVVESPEQKHFPRAPTFLVHLHAFDLPYMFLCSPDENN